MSGLIWHKPDDFPIAYDGIVIVQYKTGSENRYGTYKFWPGKGIWACTDLGITYMAAVNPPEIEGE